MKTDTINPTLAAFLSAYIKCALWSSLDDDCRPLDSSKSRADLAPNTEAQMMADCMAFMEANAGLLDASGLSVEQQGHDFWLSRNGHGAGFFDRCFAGQYKYAREEACRQLQEKANAFGECNLYISDDGLIYC